MFILLCSTTVAQMFKMYIRIQSQIMPFLVGPGKCQWYFTHKLC